MSIAIKRHPEPAKVKMGTVTFLVTPITAALRLKIRSRLRVEGDGRVDPERMEAELTKAALAGWEGLCTTDGEEVPFGPCPACAAPVTPGTGVTAPCQGCGGSKDCRDWALAAFPDAVWTPIYDEACRVLAREEEVSGN